MMPARMSRTQPMGPPHGDGPNCGPPAICPHGHDCPRPPPRRGPPWGPRGRPGLAVCRTPAATAAAPALGAPATNRASAAAGAGRRLAAVLQASAAAVAETTGVLAIRSHSSVHLPSASSSSRGWTCDVTRKWSMLAGSGAVPARGPRYACPCVHPNTGGTATGSTSQVCIRHDELLIPMSAAMHRHTSKSLKHGRGVR